MRLFIAFTLPSEPLRSIQQLLSTQGIRYTKTFHCTLAFLRDTSSSQIHTITERLNTVSFSTFTVTLSHFNFFPDTHNFRVIFIALEPQETIIHLHQSISKALYPLFIPDKPFVPHITIARVSFHTPHLLREIPKKPPYLSFPITSFALIQSTLTSSGPVYATLQQYPLRTLH